MVQGDSQSLGHEDVLQRWLQGALHGLSGVAAVVNDVLVFGVGGTMEEATVNHDNSLLKLLQIQPHAYTT